MNSHTTLMPSPVRDCLCELIRRRINGAADWTDSCNDSDGTRALLADWLERVLVNPIAFSEHLSVLRNAAPEIDAMCSGSWSTCDPVYERAIDFVLEDATASMNSVWLAHLALDIPSLQWISESVDDWISADPDETATPPQRWIGALVREANREGEVTPEEHAAKQRILDALLGDASEPAEPHGSSEDAERYGIHEHDRIEQGELLYRGSESSRPADDGSIRIEFTAGELPSGAIPKSLNIPAHAKGRILLWPSKHSIRVKLEGFLAVEREDTCEIDLLKLNESQGLSTGPVPFAPDAGILLAKTTIDGRFGEGLLKLGPEHPDTLTSMNFLALTLPATGELDASRKMHETVLEVRQRELGPEHPDTLTSMNNLALTLRAMGELDTARKMHERVLEIRQRKLGPEHPDTLTSMNYLAETLRAMGELDTARKMHERVLEVLQRKLGSEHPHTLTSMNYLAETLRAMGELDTARKMHEGVLEIRQRKLDPESTQSAIGWHSISIVWHRPDDPSQAVRLCCCFKI